MNPMVIMQDGRVLTGPYAAAWMMFATHGAANDNASPDSQVKQASPPEPAGSAQSR